MDKINSNVIDFSPAGGPAGLSVGQVYIDLDGTLKRGIFAGQSAASFEAVRQANNERYAASGFVHFGKHRNVVGNSSGGTPVNDGLWCYYSSVGNENSFRIGIADDISNMEGKSKTQHPIINIAGVIYELSQMHVAAPKQNLIKFPQAPDGKTTYHKTKGEVKVHVDAAAAFIYANQSDNIEVVTDRVDMWGFEAYLEEVTTTNPFVYPNGLIQSQATTMNGISTSASNRPVTYYSVFDGDTGSKGKGLDVTKLSYVQLATILGDHKHNLYYLADGRLVQWRLRQRTIAGAGNGDWGNVNSNLASASVPVPLGFPPAVMSPYTAQVQPQGTLDTVIGFTGLFVPSETSNVKYAPDKLERGVFTAANTGWDNYVNSVNGECYFLVCGTVNRLNQGAYHPSFNPSGAALSNYGGGSGGGPWSGPSAIKFTNKSQCFNYIPYTNSTDAGAVIFSGRIGDTSGRPDGRFYDAVYADGQGGVCRDMRYSAYGVDSVDFAEADQRVKNGTYRGFEKLIFSRAGVSDSAEYVGAWNSFNHMGVKADVGDTVIVEVLPNTFERKTVQVYTATQIMFLPVVSTNRASNLRFVVESILSQSVGGSFLQTDVIGNPVNILATPALAKGWQGSWVPIIPDGVKMGTAFEFSRKLITLPFVAIQTTDLRTWINISGWGSNTNFSQITNTPSANSGSGLYTEGSVTINHYLAFAKQTENATNAVVYGGSLGVGQVFATSDSFLPNQNRGTLLKESLTGGTKGVGGVYTNGPMQVLSVKQLTMNLDKLLSGRAAYDVKHDEIVIDGNTTVNGVKALNYNVNLNQQAFIQYAYTEIKHDGTDWGDDGKIAIVDNQATKTDLNGNTVLVGTARLREPLGWLIQSSQPRNASRTGFRVSFNQWTKDVKPLEEKGGIYGK